ncbi:hypothetical protein WN944_029228 [Citrus x changshan-huyou]|uniref:Uncharacterized protein n=1 Tax=Citrus x changshan-huyou TaxID=2935761 RepID=A0AAP0LS57_9ROSI
MLITSTRSLSVSFQGEAFSLPISKTKAKATPETRRGTPVRDQPWPGRTQQGNPNCQGGWILVLRVRSSLGMDMGRWLSRGTNILLKMRVDWAWI